MIGEELAILHGLCFTSPRPWTATEFDELLDQKSVFLCQNSRGFALGRVAGPEVELLTLAVHPTSQRQGIGRALMQKFEGQAKIEGAEQVFLEVSETNIAARALYLSCGYIEAGYRKNYYASPTDQRITAIVMKRDL